jgi:hypothetical protein
MKIKYNHFNPLYCLLFQLLNRISMFAAQPPDISSSMSGLLHLTGQLKGRAARVKDGIRN